MHWVIAGERSTLFKGSNRRHDRLEGSAEAEKNFIAGRQVRNCCTEWNTRLAEHNNLNREFLLHMVTKSPFIRSIKSIKSDDVNSPCRGIEVVQATQLDIEMDERSAVIYCALTASCGVGSDVRKLCKNQWIRNECFSSFDWCCQLKRVGALCSADRALG